MRNLCKLAAYGLVSVACLSGAAAFAQDLTIGVSFDKVEPFREAEIKALDAAIAAAGVKQVFANADKDAQRQASQVDTFLSDGVNAIISIPWDIQAGVTLSQVAKAAGVPFITMDQAPADLASVAYHVGGDPCADGKTAGEFFVKVADGKPFKLLEIQGGLANDNGIRRSKCMNDAVKAATNITIVAQVPTDWNTEKAMQGAQNTLQEHPDLNGIYQPWNDGLAGIFSALEAKGRLVPIGDPNHVVIVTIDGLPIGCKAVRDRLVDLDIATPVPDMAARAVNAAVMAAKGEAIPVTVEYLPGIPYGPDDVDAMASKLWGCN